MKKLLCIIALLLCLALPALAEALPDFAVLAGDALTMQEQLVTDSFVLTRYEGQAPMLISAAEAYLAKLPQAGLKQQLSLPILQNDCTITLYSFLSQNENLSALSCSDAKMGWTISETHLLLDLRVMNDGTASVEIICHPALMISVASTDATSAAVCNDCNGQGSINRNCTQCSGSGQVARNCPTCKGYGQRSCNTCDGSGRQSCSACGGNGQRACSNCGGRGHHGNAHRGGHHGGNHGNNNCAACRGTGRRTCSSCQNTGRNTCNTCHGYGQRGCGTCAGYGRTTTSCGTCQGIGQQSTTCTTCQGTGSCRK